jgi:hypothetical protein
VGVWEIDGEEVNWIVPAEVDCWHDGNDPRGP